MSSPYQLTRAAVVLAAALVLPFSPAHAGEPQLKTQVPGYYRLMVGGAEVTALYDGFLEVDRSMLKNASPAEVQRLLARMFAATPKLQTAVNTFLINTGDKLVLVDTGAGKLFGPTAGNILANLRASGYQPAQIDVVLLTHLHPDHLGGLIDAEGRPVFAKAEVRVSRTEADFWLSTEAAAKAPEGSRPFFKMAREAAAPLIAAGKWGTFGWGDEVVPGLKAVEARGHTPGHAAYLLESGGQRLLLWGDAVHSPAVQFARPSVTIEFDVDQKQAAATRRQLFEQAARSAELVAGAHLPFPGLGHVRAEGAGGYAWVPVEYGPIR